MRRRSRTIIVAAVAFLAAAGQASSQTRNRYDNSIDMRAPLSRQQSNVVINNQRRDLPDNCYSGVSTDRTVSCVAPSPVTAPPPTPFQSFPCTPKSALQNPQLGALPNTCP